jgi:hypothetical protein
MCGENWFYKFRLYFCNYSILNSVFVSYKSSVVAYFKFDCLNRKTILGNKWKKYLSVDIAKNIYDVFALSKWFEYDEDWNLTKNLDDNL